MCLIVGEVAVPSLWSILYISSFSPHALLTPPGLLNLTPDRRVYLQIDAKNSLDSRIEPPTMAIITSPSVREKQTTREYGLKLPIQQALCTGRNTSTT